MVVLTPVRSGSPWYCGQSAVAGTEPLVAGALLAGSLLTELPDDDGLDLSPEPPEVHAATRAINSTTLATVALPISQG
jgi:hypothetical protein